MDDLEMFGGWGDETPEPPPTKTLLQSLRAVLIALVIGAGAVSLFLVHYVASEIGYLIWVAVTIGPAFAAAYYFDSVMVGYHIWARFAVGIIIFFSVALVIMAALEAHHF